LGGESGLESVGTGPRNLNFEHLGGSKKIKGGAAMMADVMGKITALKSGRGRKNSLSQGSLLHLGGERNKLDESFHSTLDKDGENEAAYHSPNDDAVDELNFDEFQDA
jgi:hypothetical protein